jgi:hypothetical protein
VLADEPIVRVGDDIDQRIPDSNDVVLNARHVGAGYWSRQPRIRSMT